MRKWVLTGWLCLMSLGVFATEATTAEGTKNWTATRQPQVTEKPLPFDGNGTDFKLVDQNTTCFSLSLATPVQLPWGDWDVRGVRLSPIYGCCGRMTGLDVGLWNTVETDFIGLQVGVVNTASRVRGLQVGCFNGAYYLKGLQVGVINYAEGARGLQIGLINVITATTPGCFLGIYGSF